MTRDGNAEWISDGIPSLRGMIRQHMQVAEKDGDQLMRAVVAPIARQSRTQGIEPAKLVVGFKRTWMGLPEVDMLSRRDSQQLLDRAVTVLIEEYYG